MTIIGDGARLIAIAGPAFGDVFLLDGSELRARPRHDERHRHQRSVAVTTALPADPGR